MSTPRLASTQPEDPRAELERLRKMKRLQELEAKAASSAQPAAPAPQAQAQPQAASRTPLGGATGEFNLDAFAKLPKTQPRPVLPAPVDPLAPIDPAAKAAAEARRNERQGMVAYQNPQTGETYWRPDPAAQVSQEHAAYVARENAKLPPAAPTPTNPVLDGIRAADKFLMDAGGRLVNKLDPSGSVANAIGQGEQFLGDIGQDLAAPLARTIPGADEAGRFVGQGVQQFAATTARNPVQAATEVTDAFEPTHYFGQGINNLNEAAQKLFAGDLEAARKYYMEATPQILWGTLGLIPGSGPVVNSVERTVANIPRTARTLGEAERGAARTSAIGVPRLPAPDATQPPPAASQAGPQFVPPAAQPQPSPVSQPTVTQAPRGAQTATQTQPLPTQAGGAAPPIQPPANVATQAIPPQASQPGTMTPVASGNGVAVDSFNALPVKTREGILRALSASGMSREQAFDAIRSLNDLPPERANMFEAELIRRFGGPDQFPNLKTNLTAMGSDFSMQVPGKGGDPQGVMNRSMLDQAKSEGEYLERTAQQIFGPGKVATKADLEGYRQVLGGRYRKLLSEQYPGAAQKRGANRLAEQQRIDGARAQLADYLKRPDVMTNVPAWVQDEVMLQVSADLRRLQFTPEERAIILQGNPELAPLFTPDRELIYSPRLWQSLVDLYPTQVGHSLQSAYRSAIDSALKGTDAAQRTVAKRLMRMRGQSKVRANAANPDQRGYGLLYLLEDAVPGYKALRQEFGDVAGAQKAADMPDTFFRVAKDEEALADFISVYDDELTPLQQEAVRNGITTQIRQAIRNKTEFTDLTELDQAERLGLPNLTAISSRPFLEALPKVFGADGERMVDAIRLSRANVDNIASINKSFASGTPKGMEIRQNGRNIYESPSATDANPIDAATSTLAGVGGFAAANGSMQVALPVLGGAALRGLYRMYKRGKSLTPAQKAALAEWLFKPRRATDALPSSTPTRFSKAGYAGNVATGAAIGAAAGALQGDPNSVALGALGGAFGGASRAKLRSIRANKSIIPTGPQAPRSRNPLNPFGGRGAQAAVSAAPPAPRQLPGQTSMASPTVTGIVAGGIGGAMLPASSDEERARNALIGSGIGGVSFGAANRLASMGKKVKPPPVKGGPPKAPVAARNLDPNLPPPPKERFLIGSDGKQTSLGMAGEEKTVKFTAPSGKRFQIEFMRDGDAIAVDFREVGAKAGYKPTGTGSAGEANAVLGAVQDAIRADVAEFGRPRYMFVGDTNQQSRIYQNMARTTEPPKGYRWEGPDNNGAVYLQRVDLAPPKSPDGSELSAFPGGDARPAPLPAPAKPVAGGKPPPKASQSSFMSGIAGRAAVGLGTGAAVSLASDAVGQEDLSGKIGQTEQSIASLKKTLADFETMSARDKQQFLKDAGFYAGKIDGNIAGMTTEGIERWNAKQEAAIGDAEAKLVELVRRDAYKRNQPDAFMTALRDVGPSAAGLFALLGLKYMRGSAAKKSVLQAETKAAKLNQYITKVPAKGPLTSLATKSGTDRPANLNALWQKGGASKSELPFRQDGAGRWVANAKAKPADELFVDNPYWGAITKYVKGKDLALILGGGFDAAIAQVGIDHATNKLKEAEAEWKANPSDETFKRVEDAQNELAMYNLVQRVGGGLAAGRILGTLGNAYVKGRPNIPAAATEQAAIKQFITANKPPPKPRAPRKLPLPPSSGRSN